MNPQLLWQPELCSMDHTCADYRIISFIAIFLFSFLNLQSLLETHDSVASKNYETPPPSPCLFMDAALNNQPVPPDAVRMVGIRKVSGEHLVSPLNKRFSACLFLTKKKTFRSSKGAWGDSLLHKGWFKCSDCRTVWAEQTFACIQHFNF